MSFSLAVANGDLVLQGDQLAIVSGAPLLKQTMDLWIRERAGIDRFHPTFGSRLQDFIGGVVTPDTRVEIITEIERVLLNIQAVQTQAVKDAPQKFSLSELLMDILSVNAQASYDTVSATISVANGDRAPVTTKTSSTTVGS
jgi:phage baseplate assembly protein W